MFYCREKCVICIAFSAKLSQTYRAGLWVDSGDARVEGGCTLILPRDAAQDDECPESPKNVPGEPRKPCSRVSTAAQDWDHTEHFPPSLLPLVGRSTPISLEMQQRSQIPEETAWHLFPMKSLQKQAEQPTILDISARFPQCVWSALGHCCAFVPTLSGGCCSPPAPRGSPAGS